MVDEDFRKKKITECVARMRGWCVARVNPLFGLTSYYGLHERGRR